jgi:hypothetical protein
MQVVEHAQRLDGIGAGNASIADLDEKIRHILSPRPSFTLSAPLVPCTSFTGMDWLPEKEFARA